METYLLDINIKNHTQQCILFPDVIYCSNERGCSFINKRESGDRLACYYWSHMWLIDYNKCWDFTKPDVNEDTLHCINPADSKWERDSLYTEWNPSFWGGSDFYCTDKGNPLLRNVVQATYHTSPKFYHGIAKNNNELCFEFFNDRIYVIKIE